MTVHAESRFIEVNGTRLHFLHWQSDGQPILIIHGNTHAGGVYEPLGDRLSLDFEVLALDLRGHGLSDRPGDYSWSAFREDVVGFLDRLDLRNAAIVAHSRGGGVTLLSAAARPDRVRGVVVYEPTLPASIAGARLAAETAESRAAQLMARAQNRRSSFANRDEVYRHFQGRGAFKDWRDDYLRAFVRHCVVEAPGGAVELASPTDVEALLYRAMFQTDAWDEIVNCELPVLTVYGEHGGRLGPGREPVAAVRRFFPNTRMQVLEDASHSGPMEQPEAFEAIIRDFIASLSPLSSARRGG